jgi:hypothetical protein
MAIAISAPVSSALRLCRGSACLSANSITHIITLSDTNHRQSNNLLSAVSIINAINSGMYINSDM